MQGVQNNFSLFFTNVIGFKNIQYAVCYVLILKIIFFSIFFVIILGNVIKAGNPKLDIIIVFDQVIINKLTQINQSCSLGRWKATRPLWNRCF